MLEKIGCTVDSGHSSSSLANVSLMVIGILSYDYSEFTVLVPPLYSGV